VEQQAGALEARIAAGELEQAEVLRALAWFGAHQVLAAQLGEAESARNAAQAAFAAAAPRRARLRDVDRAQPLRPVQAGTLQAARNLADQEARVRAEQERLPAARDAVAAARAEQGRDREALASARKAVLDARPLLAAARELDAGIRAGTIQYDAEADHSASLARAVAAAEDTVAGTGSARAELEARLKALDEGLERSRPDQPLVEAWAGVQPAIRQYAEARAAGQLAADALRKQQEQIETLEAQRTAAQDRLDGLARERDELAGRMRDLQAGMPAQAGAGLEAARKAASARLEQLKEAAALLTRVQAAGVELARAEAKSAAQQGRRARAQEQAGAAERELPLVLARLAEAKGAL
jgi:hypothetical protein